MRNLMAFLLVPVLVFTGFRFSKDYRWGTTRWHRLVFRCVDTMAANRMASINGPMATRRDNAQA